MSPQFQTYIGIDYSGAETAESSLKGIRVFMAQRNTEPIEVQPPPSPRWYWSRRGLAEWVTDQILHGPPTLIGIDHGFSFPLDYFTKHGLTHDWDSFLDDFQLHWPTDASKTTVDFIRHGAIGNGIARTGDSKWFRMTELWSTSAKSVFLFDVNGSVAKSTHAGLPWLRSIRRKVGNRCHFWPFDGWEIPAGKSCVAEVYPSLFRKRFLRESPSDHQHDAYAVAKWLRRTDENGYLSQFFFPSLDADERKQAQIEGWILGLI